MEEVMEYTPSQVVWLTDYNRRQGFILGILLGVGVTSAAVAVATRRHLEKHYPEQYKNYLTRK